MIVKGLIDNPKWEKVLVCTCQGKIDLCLHCKYSKALESIPKENFKIKIPLQDKNGHPTGKTETRTVKEIRIISGSHDDVQGWIW